MKRFTIIAIEIGMLLGILAAALTVPPSTPLLTFLLISGAFFAVGNLLLVKRLRKSRSGEYLSNGQRKPRLYPAFILIAAYWLFWLFLHKG
jgi:hypothetical protein